MKTAIVGDLYGTDITSYIIRQLIKKYNLYCINTKESNLHYDKYIHEKEIKITEVDHLILATSLEKTFFYPDKKLTYLLLGYSSKIDLLKLNGFDSILTFNPQVYNKLVELKFKTAILIDPPTLTPKNEVKRIYGPKDFIVGFTEYNPEVLYTILEKLDRDLNYGFLVSTVNSTLISYDITEIKSKTHSLTPVYIHNIEYSTHSIARIFKSSHLIIDTSGFFRNIQVNKSYWYKTNIVDFYSNFQKVYRLHYKNQLSKTIEPIQYKTNEIKDIL